LLEDVPFGHKVCIRDTPAGAEVTKYGQVIGTAATALQAGQHAHVHNVESARGRGDQVKR
jgi:altronate dehydratase small subunit